MDKGALQFKLEAGLRHPRIPSNRCRLALVQKSGKTLIYRQVQIKYHKE
jgi:hypothetical protein